jgi:hypothetical protein
VKEAYQETRLDLAFVVIAEAMTFCAFFGWHEILQWDSSLDALALKSAVILVFIIQVFTIYLHRLYPIILFALLMALPPFIYFLNFFLVPADEYRFWSFTELLPLSAAFGNGKTAIPLFMVGMLIQISALSLLLYRRLRFAWDQMHIGNS